ncbi:LysR family transcriptional regulator [Pseudomonas syringae pv. persicae]|nr:LysR family transcriptional regulator [Pseudomonas syringae pv. persicae]
MLTLKVENEVFYAGFIVRPGGYSKFKVVDAAVLMSMALESKGVA